MAHGRVVDPSLELADLRAESVEAGSKLMKPFQPPVALHGNIVLLSQVPGRNAHAGIHPDFQRLGIRLPARMKHDPVPARESPRTGWLGGACMRRRGNRIPR